MCPTFLINISSKSGYECFNFFCLDEDNQWRWHHLFICVNFKLDYFIWSASGAGLKAVSLNKIARIKHFYCILRFICWFYIFFQFLFCFSFGCCFFDKFCFRFGPLHEISLSFHYSALFHDTPIWIITISLSLSKYFDNLIFTLIFVLLTADFNLRSTQEWRKFW